MQFYNHSRPQRKINKLTPVEFRRQRAAWRPGCFLLYTRKGLDQCRRGIYLF
ncbi:IS3 family transposase [Bacillus sp. FJAT-27238]|uniref:IS3 family transposase n=1 Tax=Bacillus sp. FJAT-27238 TaxID=1679167 RepID=UPI00336BF15A